jgi:DNA-binding NarL/FixJ family response regulator
VIIADSDPFARRVIRDALQGEGIVVIAEASDGQDVVDLSVHYRPDVVLMDVLPHLDRIGAIRRILDRVPSAAVLIVSAEDEEDLGLLCLRSGAIGYLSKSVELGALTRATRAAAAGQAVISRRLTMRLIEILRRTANPAASVRPVSSELTAREWEVLDLLSRDLATAEIASTLLVSNETVRSHIRHILHKLRVHTRQEAVDLASRLR